MTDIIPFARGEAIGLRCRRLFQEWQAVEDRWIEKTMEFAAALLDARTECGGNDVSFSHWLIDNGLERLDYNTRASLIGIAMHPALSEGIMKESGRSSVRHIWEQEIKPFLAQRAAGGAVKIERTSAEVGSLPDRADPPRGEPDRHQNDRSQSEESQQSPSYGPTSARLSDKGHRAGRPRKFDKRAPVTRLNATAGYFGMPRAEEIMPLYRHVNGRTSLSLAMKESPAAKREIWSLVTSCVDAGLLKENDYSGNGTTRSKPMLRLLLTDLPDRVARNYDLREPASRREIRNVVLPAVLDQLDAYRKDPASIEQLIHAWKRKQAEVASTRVATPAPASPARPGMQPDIVMFGVQLWPIAEARFGTYDYDQLRMAIWAFLDLQDTLVMTNDNSPKSRAITTRFSTRYYDAYARRCLDEANSRRMRGIFQLVNVLANLMEQNPSGPCAHPVRPHGDLGWE